MSPKQPRLIDRCYRPGPSRRSRRRWYLRPCRRCRNRRRIATGPCRERRTQGTKSPNNRPSRVFSSLFFLLRQMLVVGGGICPLLGNMPIHNVYRKIAFPYSIIHGGLPKVPFFPRKPTQMGGVGVGFSSTKGSRTVTEWTFSIKMIGGSLCAHRRQVGTNLPYPPVCFILSTA